MAKFRKIRRAGKKIRRVARSLTGGIKGTVVEGGAGLVVAYGDTALRKVEAIGKKDWASPALVIVAGHLMKKAKRIGNAPAAIIGAGGVLLGQALQRARAAKAAATPAAPPSGGTSGFGDTGMVYRFPSPTPVDTGFVTRSGARKINV